MKITVNDKEFELQTAYVVSYEQVVRMAGLTGQPSVVYHVPHKGDVRRDGIMHPGCKPALLEEGIRFEAIHTGNA